MKRDKRRILKRCTMLKQGLLHSECYSTSFQIKKTKWTIHQYDKDSYYPSCPHMHAIGKPWKLNLYSGEIIDIPSNAIISIVKLQDLIRIWRDPDIQKVIIKARQEYEKLRQRNPRRYPALPSPIIPLDRETRWINVDARYGVFNKYRGRTIHRSRHVIKLKYKPIVIIRK